MIKTVDNGAFPLASEVRSLVSSNGKMLRPALLLIGSGFGTKADKGRLTSLGAAVELLHVSTLIHDDVIDDADLRRGRPTLHTTLGSKEAILAGDWLFSRCFLLTADSADAEGSRSLARVIAAICASEIRQDLDKWSYSTSIRSYRRIIAGKTAALFALSLQVGANEAKAPKQTAQRLRRAGYDIGMAFQIMDDILDFESSEGMMRKPVGKDIAEGLCTLPLIHALRADEKGIRALLAAVRPDGATVEMDAVQAVIARCAELGAVDEAKLEVKRFTDRAQQEVESLPRGGPRDELASLADRLLSRRY
jgi:heptaprenyl diphosphate synthase